MNKRIRQLWTQAGGHYNSGNQHTWPEYTIDDPEKFAELIVKKCMDIAYDHTPNSEECEYKRLIHNKIKEHFGVEE